MDILLPLRHPFWFGEMNIVFWGPCIDRCNVKNLSSSLLFSFAFYHMKIEEKKKEKSEVGCNRKGRKKRKKHQLTYRNREFSSL